MGSVQLVRQAIEAYATGGIGALARFYQPEAEIVGGPFFGPEGTYRGGPDALQSITDVVKSNHQELTVSPTEVRAGELRTAFSLLVGRLGLGREDRPARDLPRRRARARRRAAGLVI
jgi:hypothetical protein